MDISLHITRLTIKDLDAFYAMRLEALQNSPSSFSSSYEEESEKGKAFFQKILEDTNDRNFILGAFVDNALIGSIGIYSEQHIKLQHKGNIWGVYVKPNHRKRGIAKQLLRELIKQAKPHFQQLCISVNTANIFVKQLYESQGFVAWGTELQAMLIDKKYYDEIHMKLVFA